MLQPESATRWLLNERRLLVSQLLALLFREVESLACYAVAVPTISQIARLTTSAVLLLVTVMSAPAFAAGIKDVILSPDKLPSGCKTIDGQYPVDIQISILYDYKVYKDLLPELADKLAQSFECDGEKASLFFFQYKSSGDRTKSEHFIRPLLWGGDKPSREHPELIKEYDNILVIVSARKTAEKLG